MTRKFKNGWIEDENGNRCSVGYFGDEESARKALESLENCKNCSNCSNCSYCSDCSYCSNCSDCSYCSNCSYCSDCSYCSGCSYCSNCSDCSYCSGCSDCSYCSGCSYCSDCSYCSYCSYCSGCSNVACLCEKKDLKGDPESDWKGPPPIPKIENIHQTVYAAASQNGCLKMDSWHTCGTVHCRAGWVVHLAGEAGYALESFHNTLLAAQLIYRESGYQINPCRFYDNNDTALADMKKLAEAEGG